ncbi:DMT family transporter [Reichenbachiella ulvae]|uniref:DMT family transporter n=1 Tax=Reichenbachiella ulvae TaxID=2980104 RepID=A0ABT3CP03_9BACT|nr:DMT family transporter [Reichenbachiella ulvae]MCV9385377.1 DMT family transporter [Reichenbachiella ulvae]
MNNKRQLGFALAFLGVVMFSAKAVMVKLAYVNGVEAVSLLLLRMLFALPVYLLITSLNFSKLKTRLNPKNLWALLLFGFLGYYLASYFDFLGLKFIKASLERIILFIYPTIVLILSFLFLKKKIESRQVIAIAITYLGVLVMYYQEPDFSSTESMLGVGLILLSALTYASYLVGSDWLIPQLGSTLFTSLAMIVSCICVILHYCMVGDFDLFNYPAEVYGLSIAMATLSTIIPSYLISYAIKLLGASDFSVMASMGPVSTIILAWVFLGEQLTVIQIVGAIVVIVGVYYVTRKKQKS